MTLASRMQHGLKNKQTLELLVIAAATPAISLICQYIIIIAMPITLNS